MGQAISDAVAARLATDQEVEKFLMLFDEPAFNCTLPMMMSTWGRRP